MKAQEAEVDKLITEISAQADQLQSREAVLGKARDNGVTKPLWDWMS